MIGLKKYLLGILFMALVFCVFLAMPQAVMAADVTLGTGGMYSTLSDAILNAGAGGKITLLSDFTENSSVYINDDLTIDLNGWTFEIITTAGDALTIGGNFTLENTLSSGKMIARGADSGIHIRNLVSSKIHINGAELDTEGSSAGIWSAADSTLIEGENSAQLFVSMTGNGHGIYIKDDNKSLSFGEFSSFNIITLGNGNGIYFDGKGGKIVFSTVYQMYINGSSMGNGSGIFMGDDGGSITFNSPATINGSNFGNGITFNGSAGDPTIINNCVDFINIYGGYDGDGTTGGFGIDSKNLTSLSFGGSGGLSIYANGQGTGIRAQSNINLRDDVVLNVIGSSDHAFTLPLSKRIVFEDSNQTLNFTNENPLIVETLTLQQPPSTPDPWKFDLGNAYIISGNGRSPIISVELPASGHEIISLSAEIPYISTNAVALTAATAGTFYSNTAIAVVPGSIYNVIYGYEVSAGSLPSGFTISNSGVISGTTASIGTHTFAVRTGGVYTGGSLPEWSAPVQYSIVVASTVPTPTPPPTGGVGVGGGGGGGGGGPVAPSSAISPAKIDYEKSSGKDVDITVSLVSGALSSLSNGAKTLAKDKDYINKGSAVTIKAAYLAALPLGESIISFNINDGKSLKLTVNVTDKSPASPSPKPTVPPDRRPLTSSRFFGTAVDSGIRLEWLPADKAIGYRIYRSLTRDEEGVSLTKHIITGLFFVDVNVKPNTAYYYTIRPVYSADPEVLGDVYAKIMVETGDEILGEAVDGMTKNFILMRLGNEYMSVNGTKQEIDPGRGTAPLIQNGRTLVPIRAIIECMGGAVDWDAATEMITLDVGGNNIIMWLNRADIEVNGETREMDVTPVTINARTMVPIRFAAENAGCVVDWLSRTEEVVVVFYTAAEEQ